MNLAPIRNIDIQPVRSQATEILQQILENNARKEEMAFRKTEQDARLSELNRKAMAEKRLQEALNVPTTREQTVQDTNAFNFLAREGADPSQFTTSERVPVPESDRMKQQIKNLVSVGDIQGAKQLQDIYEKQKDDQEAGVTYQYYLKNPSGWKQDMIRDFPDRAEDINKTSFTPDGRTLIYNDKERGGFWSRDVRTGKEEFKAYPKETVTAHNVIEVPSPDGKTAQKFQYNAKTNTYDIPVGQKYLVKSQVPSVTISQTQLPSADMDILADMLYEGRLDPADLSKRGGNQQIAAIYRRAEERNPGFDPRGTKAENAAFQSTLIQQEKQRGAVGSFVKNIDEQIKTVYDIMKYLQRTDARAINIPMRELRTRLVGSGLENKYDMFISEISAESSKLSQSAAQSIAQLPEGSREKWEKIHDLNLPISQMKILLDGTSHMGKIRLKSLDDEIIDTKKRRKTMRSSTGVNTIDNQQKATHKYIPGKGIVEIK
jgi:hypothetical protein